MMQPRWQPCVASPPRSVISAACVSPLICVAPSNWPALKLRVGYPPASLRMLVRTLVPNDGRPVPVTPCRRRPSLNVFAAALKRASSAGWRVLVPVSSRMNALIFFEPITAPTPPRPMWRVGWSSRSQAAIEAAGSIISPAWPMSMKVTFSPCSARSFSTVS